MFCLFLGFQWWYADVLNNSYTYQFWVEEVQNSQSGTVNGYLIGVCAFHNLVSIRCSIQRLHLVGWSTVLWYEARLESAMA